MRLLGLEDRASDTPPCDSLAEAIVLHGLLYRPYNLARYDVRPLLVFPEHRVCLAAMVRAYAITGEDAPWGRFYMRWMDELERLRPGCGHLLVTMLDTVADDESTWRWARYEETRDDEPSDSIHDHDWNWWLERLKRVAEARRLIQSAQDIVDRAWRGDVDGAYAAVPTRPLPDVGMDIP